MGSPYGGRFPRAVDLSRHAQHIAPVGGSAIIQATAQEGRAWARIGDRKATRSALDRVEAMTASLQTLKTPEHHYRYDPAKALSYAATTLSWVGDPAAEPIAREVIAGMEAGGEPARPRRIASARLDLGLALLAAGKPDEAASVAVAALESGRIVPSNWWRVTDVLAGVERLEISEAAELRDAFGTHSRADSNACPSESPTGEDAEIANAAPTTHHRRPGLHDVAGSG